MTCLPLAWRLVYMTLMIKQAPPILLGFLAGLIQVGTMGQAVCISLESKLDSENLREPAIKEIGTWMIILLAQAQLGHTAQQM
jgi:hypothetical protein